MEIQITSVVDMKCPHCFKTFQEEITLTDDIECERAERDEF